MKIIKTIKCDKSREEGQIKILIEMINRILYGMFVPIEEKERDKMIKDVVKLKNNILKFTKKYNVGKRLKK